MVFAGIGFVFGRKEACSERASPSSIYRLNFWLVLGSVWFFLFVSLFVHF